MTALADLRSEARLSTNSIASELGTAFLGRIEEAIVLGFAEGFEAARGSAMGEIIVRCNEYRIDIEIAHKLVMAISQIKKPLPP